MQKHVQNRLIKHGGSCREPGHSRGWHNPPALRGFASLGLPFPSSFGSKGTKVCAKCNRVGVFSHPIRLPDASCWASVLYRGTSNKDSITQPLFLRHNSSGIIEEFQGQVSDGEKSVCCYSSSTHHKQHVRWIWNILEDVFVLMLSIISFPANF